MANQHQQLQELIDKSQKIVIVQADNPDGDSLASSLALEQILGEMGKDIHMYCSMDVPEHLKHLSGWDRVEQNFPSQYDLAIMVDNSYSRLLGNMEKKGQLGTLKSKPLVIFDHHSSQTDIDYADIYINEIKMASAGQVIYTTAKELGWPIDVHSAKYIASSILSDSLGFNSEVMKDNPEPLRVMANLVELGVDLSELNELRLERLKSDASLVEYRGQLLQRIEFHEQGSIATITIPYEEVRQYSMQYNPTVILDEMRMVKGVKIGIGFKQFVKNGQLVKITARIRCNRGFTIAKDLAERYDGGGHPYASGIKWEGAELNFDEIKASVLKDAAQLLNEID